MILNVKIWLFYDPRPQKGHTHTETDLAADPVLQDFCNLISS